jgi:hypothetical protein
MSDNVTSNEESVMVSMELNGKYEDIINKLGHSTSRSMELDEVAGDLSILLETVVQLDGGTRSAIAERLADETTVDYDSEAVVNALRVLERYGLVTLDGNTWMPGRELHVD